MKRTREQKMQAIRQEIKNLRMSRDKCQTKIDILENQFSLLQRENLVEYHNNVKKYGEQKEGEK